VNYYEHHIGDYAQATAHLSFIEDAAYSRLIRKYYAEEKNLPADIKSVQRLVGARTKEEREAVANILEEFFTLESDGWHNKRCDAEIAKYQGKQVKARASAQARWDKRKPDAMRTHSESDANASQGNDANAMRTQCEGNAHQTPDTRHQTPDLKPNPEESASTSPPTSTPSGRVCARLRRLGIQGVNPSNPKLLALLASGVPEAEFSDLAEEPIAKGKGLAWILAAVEGRRRDAASVGIPEAEAPKPRPVCAICGAFASKQIGRTDYCPNHDQFSERVSA
jgi:uncharacterized protein YdaU (DUF1376 family)